MNIFQKNKMLNQLYRMLFSFFLHSFCPKMRSIANKMRNKCDKSINWIEIVALSGEKRSSFQRHKNNKIKKHEKNKNQKKVRCHRCSSQPITLAIKIKPVNLCVFFITLALHTHGLFSVFLHILDWMGSINTSSLYPSA